MCDRCEGDMKRRIDLTEETFDRMINEATHAALLASTAYATGWHDAARGYMADMGAIWGSAGLARMAYVWGSARALLPSPPGRPDSLGYEQMTQLIRRVEGEEPSPETVARLVAEGDQLGAACNAVAQAASKGDLAELVRVISDYAREEPRRLKLTLLILMAEAAVRLRYSQVTEAEMEHELFMAHIHADVPDVDDEKGETRDADL